MPGNLYQIPVGTCVMSDGPRNPPQRKIICILKSARLQHQRVELLNRTMQRLEKLSSVVETSLSRVQRPA
ncbi:unnamed protein product [Leptosia nina]|uniref:Uncharacterized protein n=1 Tax=Leptosia nina TaxID=320188 RepID=A0AAV1J9R9_9NEOP